MGSDEGLRRTNSKLGKMSHKLYVFAFRVRSSAYEYELTAKS